MALSQDDIIAIQQIINDTNAQNNANLLNQVKSMIQTSQSQPAYQQPQTDIQSLARQVLANMQQNNAGYCGVNNGYYTNQYSNMTIGEVMNQPALVRDAMLQVMSTPNMSPEYQALNKKIDDLTEQLQWEQWKNCKHHSKRKTALKIGVATVGVGAGAYAIHKFKHRHDHDKSMEALTSLGNRYLDLKYGSDV